MKKEHIIILFLQMKNWDTETVNYMLRAIQLIRSEAKI
jgi:hypothetical protein